MRDTQVTTLLSSGNVVFSALAMEGPALERRVEAALEQRPRDPRPGGLHRLRPGTAGTRLMTLIERTFGKEVTTRTWDTVRKVAATPE